MVIYNVYSSVLRGLGDSKASFWAIVLSSIVNVITDIIFVVFLRHGVIGAAISTILSQILMAIFIVVYTSKNIQYSDFE